MEKRKRGRPTKRTPENEAEILAAVELGVSPGTAGVAYGVSRDVMTRWLQDDIGFRGRVQAAIARGIIARAKEASVTENSVRMKHAHWFAAVHDGMVMPTKVEHSGTLTISSMLAALDSGPSEEVEDD